MSAKSRVSPLVVSVAFLLSIMSASSSPVNATRRPGTPGPRSFSHDDEDYYNIYEETPSAGPSALPPSSGSLLCEYDICKDGQKSCQKLALALSCSCPGIGGPFDAPDAPSLQSVSFESESGGVVVRWCAPSSTVTHYLVRVEGRDEEWRADDDRRMIELGDLAPGAEVCVEAVNMVAASVRGDESCARFQPGSSEKRLAVKLVLIGAALVSIAAIVVAAFLLWWCRRHRNTPTRTANPRAIHKCRRSGRRS